ncbi:hypothetical protein [Paenibacillus xylaniclasticus]|uniref:hypothetical protein n=1 Tax=Paenibacillus xylaniclasticus TaxID=588083 RepID=UPI000FD76323|nr:MULTISPECIES: hypothetical protein [Paenibacillus]GFN30491.1 hypothetical protein PCURB6_07510 [Paenibacillus curdlanolyticus]
MPFKPTIPNEAEVEALFNQIIQEQSGRLDILVNDAWGGDPLVDLSLRFWEHSLADGLRLQNQAVQSHMITSYYTAPIMAARRSGLFVEITDGWERHNKNDRVLTSWDLSEEYGVKDVDGRQPHWGRNAKTLGLMD